MKEREYNKLKWGIWAYFLLLVFEGALRKWVLPGLADPLLIVRDPIALWLIIRAWQHGLLTSNFYLIGMWIVGILGIATALVFGHKIIFIALFGARLFLIHFPLMFVIGALFDRSDVEKMGKAMVWISIPMAILVITQFYSPQSAWVNQASGGLEGGGFSGAKGYFRGSATFSFTNGTHLFFGLVASYIFYYWLNPGRINKILLILSTISILVVIPYSISRSLLFHVLIAFLFAFVVAIRKGKYLWKMIVGLMTVLVLILFIKDTESVQLAFDVFFTRFDNASTYEGGLGGTVGERYFGQITRAIEWIDHAPFFGEGLGLGTNVATIFLGSSTFIVAEEEWSRLIGELGPILGIMAIMIRLLFSADLTWRAYQCIKMDYLLPWMLLSFGLLIIPQGQWAQPTALGFSTLVGGLIIASFNLNKT